MNANMVTIMTFSRRSECKVEALNGVKQVTHVTGVFEKPESVSVVGASPNRCETRTGSVIDLCGCRGWFPCQGILVDDNRVKVIVDIQEEERFGVSVSRRWRVGARAERVVVAFEIAHERKVEDCDDDGECFASGNAGVLHGDTAKVCCEIRENLANTDFVFSRNIGQVLTDELAEMLDVVRRKSTS